MSTLQQHAQSISTTAGDYLTARAHHEKLGRGARRLPHLSNHDIQSRQAGVQIWTNLDSKWTPRDLFHDVEERKHFRNSMFRWGLFWWTW